MAAEFISAIDFQTDGDWALSDELSALYLEAMYEDGGFDGRVRFFDNLADAWEWNIQVLDCAVDGGLFRRDSRFPESDEAYIRGIQNILDALVGNIEDAEHFEKVEEAALEGDSGGFEFRTECGNWSAEVAIYIRLDGRIHPEIGTCWL